MNRLIPFVLLLAPALALAADAPAPDQVKPKSPAALSAISRAEKAQAQADADYKSAVLAAKRVELAELRAAQDAAMKNGAAAASPY